jgi:hypothetical protein
VGLFAVSLYVLRTKFHFPPVAFRRVGKLKESQILSGMEALKEIERLIIEGVPRGDALRELSNTFVILFPLSA